MVDKKKYEKDFPDLPILVIHDTVISDILGEVEITSYKDSAIFITNYFLMRQALIGMDSGKSGIATTQVLEIFEKLSEDKTNTLQAIKDWIEETTFTEKLPLNEKTSTYVYSHFISRRHSSRTGKRVILVCNDDSIDEKLISFYKESPWQVKDIRDLPFAVMNTDILKDSLYEIDKDFFEFISDLI